MPEPNHFGSDFINVKMSDYDQRLDALEWGQFFTNVCQGITVFSNLSNILLTFYRWDLSLLSFCVSLVSPTLSSAGKNMKKILKPKVKANEKSPVRIETSQYFRQYQT